uniref:Transducin/WD40 repeat-like superfamily protein n=1 Tax=Chenopodium quinoa TaxID=63459 RepID=A0A803KM31_CHEQI
MDRYVVPIESSTNPKSIRRPRWKRTAIELNGCIESKYKRVMCGLLVQSYSQIGVFPHLYHIDGRPCQTHMNRVMSFAGLDHQGSFRRHGVSALEFDNQKLDYLSAGWKEDETKHLLHISTSRHLDSVRWNPANQDEVACTSLKSCEVLIYDIGYVSSDPVEILTKRASVTIHGSDIVTGLSDIAFTSDDSRVFASDTYGSINIWDRRRGSFPSVELTTNSHNALNSIQLNVENQIVYGAGKQGMIYMWDLRGGRTSAAFQSHKEAYHPPMASVKVSSLLEKIKSLKAQSHIVPKDIHSINLDPTSSYRLAFHLDDGWTGSDITNLSYFIKPSWLSTNSIYAVGSASDKGLHLLDFFPDPSSPCHVDCSEEMVNSSRQNGFIPLSEDVSACATHPQNGFIVAGTKQASLLMIGQRKKSLHGDEGP